MDTAVFTHPATLSVPPPQYLFLLFLGFVFSVVMYYRIARKMGFSGTTGLLMAFPFVNLAVLAVCAFSTWPLQKELDLERAGKKNGLYGFPAKRY